MTFIICSKIFKLEENFFINFMLEKYFKLLNKLKIIFSVIIIFLPHQILLTKFKNN